MKLKKKEGLFFFFLIFFSIYCSVTVGQSWDEPFHILQGKITLEYLFSLGKIDKELFYREYYSPSYWSIKYLIMKIFPSKYQVEISHLVNLSVSIGTIIGFGKLGKELFNKEIGKIIFLILFFYPVFFGHMGLNGKDTILAFSHVWITYLLLRYIKNQNYSKKANRYICSLSVLGGIGTGIQMLFLGSLFPILLFVILDIFIFKKIVSKNFKLKKFFYDILKCFFIFYFFIIIFWIDTHSNIFYLPFKFFTEFFSENFYTGWPFNLINGNYYFSDQIPKSYLLINFIYKSPEYILLLYFVFFILLIKFGKFFQLNFKNFNYKIIFIISFLLFLNLLLFVLPFPIYDGMRLFIWTLPYFCIIPGLTIYFLIKNFKNLFFKTISLIIGIMVIYFMYDFFKITPYQYVYLNSLNGKKEFRYKKFENDYWGVSLKELIKNSNLNFDEKIYISTCGINEFSAKKYFKEKGHRNLRFVKIEKADYIIMTNRATHKESEIKSVNNIINCFDRYLGKNIYSVKRDKQILSVIRKIEKIK